MKASWLIVLCSGCAAATIDDFSPVDFASAADLGGGGGSDLSSDPATGDLATAGNLSGADLAGSDLANASGDLAIVSGARPRAGTASGSCTGGVPSSAQPADVSHPTTVIGNGSAASCTESALAAAIAKGGVITFSCGATPVTIHVTSTIEVPSNLSTVIDGGGLVTLDGGGSVRILHFNSNDFQANENRLTLQHLTLVNGKATGTQAIPVAPAPCSQGFDDGEGGALYMRDGNLTVIDCVFDGNQAAQLGPDTGGGAIYVLGSKHGAIISASTFTNNSAANAGAVGGLFTELDVYESLFTNNHASGNGANYDDATQCSVINNGQHEVGSGGNGGAVYSDGNSVNVLLCGDSITNNAAGANAFGGGLFFTSNNFGGTLTITDTTMSGNTGGSWTNAQMGGGNAGSAVGTNCKSVTITNSKLQGVP